MNTMINRKKTKQIIANEILAVVDIVSKEKGISSDDILCAMEDAILVAAENKYGKGRNLSVKINRSTGEIDVICAFLVVENVTDPLREIDQKNINRLGLSSGSIGEVVYEKLPPINFNRVTAKNVRLVMMNRIKTIERTKQEDDFKNLIGTIVSGIVKRQDTSEVIVDINGVEGVLRRSDMIPHESFRNGDHVKTLLHSINRNVELPLLRLSRTHPDFLSRLFEQEVPEIYDGIVQIHSVARDPGSKSKISVYASDPTIDPIGACVGIRGLRVQAVVNELNGEKVDIILWSKDLANFVVNSLPNINVVRVVLDEEANAVDVIVPDEQFSNAIGRSGQNVKLSSRLTGCSINIITESDDKRNRAREQEILMELFMNALDVDEMVARLLISEGYTYAEEIANEDIAYLADLPGFNEDIAVEIKNRANDYIKSTKNGLKDYCVKNGIDTSILEYNIKINLLDKLLKSGNIKCLNDIGNLEVDELLEMSDGIVNRREAESIIMDIRRQWFD